MVLANVNPPTATRLLQNLRTAIPGESSCAAIELLSNSTTAPIFEAERNLARVFWSLLLGRSTICGRRNALQGRCMTKVQCEYRYLRSFVVSAFLVLAIAANAAGGSRLHLPQSSAELALNAENLKSILTSQNGEDADMLAPQITRVLIASLPKEFHDACREMVPNFGPEAAAKTTWEWSVRRLHVEDNDIQQSALLALRCTAHVPDITYY